MTIGHEQKIGWSSSTPNAQTERSYATPVDRADIEQAVKKLISERRKRSCYFPSNFFADPAWDILLVLTLAQTRDQRISVSRLCERLDVPTTTALRWINALTEAGLLIRRDDATDKRRKYIELASHAYVSMTAYCSTTGANLRVAA